MAATIKMPTKIMTAKNELIASKRNLESYDEPAKRAKFDHDLKRDIKHVNFKKFTPTSTDEDNDSDDSEALNKSKNTNKNTNTNYTNSETTMETPRSPSPSDMSSLNSSPRKSHTRRTQSLDIKSSDIPSSESAANEPVAELENNVDFIALTSTWNLLHSQKLQLERQMVELNELKKTSLRNPKQFIQDLNNNRLNLPKPLTMVKCPMLNCSKYGLSKEESDKLGKAFQDGIVKSKPLFKTMNLFSK